MDPKLIIEAALLSAGRPLGVDRLQALFDEPGRPNRDQIREYIGMLRGEWDGRGIEVVEVGSGYRVQVKQALAPWISRLWEERRPRYSRALMETLALIAYRQPITRAEIEDVRGVAVSSHIIKTLYDREWIRVVGHRDVPGRPTLFGTTRQFLDQFNLKTLSELPPLSEIDGLEQLQTDLDLHGDRGVAEHDPQTGPYEVPPDARAEDEDNGHGRDAYQSLPMSDD